MSKTDVNVRRTAERAMAGLRRPESSLKAAHVSEVTGAGRPVERLGHVNDFTALGGKGGSRTWEDAERDLLKKIHHFNNRERGRYLARVAFAPGDAERVMDIGAEKGNFIDPEE